MSSKTASSVQSYKDGNFDGNGIVGYVKPSPRPIEVAPKVVPEQDMLQTPPPNTSYGASGVPRTPPTTHRVADDHYYNLKLDAVRVDIQNQNQTESQPEDNGVSSSSEPAPPSMHMSSSSESEASVIPSTSPLAATAPA